MRSRFSLFDHVPVGVIVCDEEMNTCFWNVCIEDWTGIRRSEIIGKPLVSFFPRFATDRYRERLKLLIAGGPPVIFSYQLNGCVFPHRDSMRIERVQHVTATSFTEKDGKRYVLLAVEDRTEVSSRIRAARLELAKRIETEQVLQKSADEKEYLMRELNHRVKNNLNMILSLISLQKDSAVSGPMRAALDDLDGRIRSFSVLHETLHKRDASATIRIDEYLETIVRELFESMKPAYSTAELRIDIQPVELPFQTALYLGLIASEALTNAMKYGLKPSGDGTVSISLAGNGSGGVLRVTDDGPGFPQGFDPEKGDSLGIKLIRLLAEELGGEAEFESVPGARISLEFNTGT